ncbi:tRNA (guanine(10)-N2)-methyltransferase [Teratosphaeria destructans]|uniref:tRNA (guanine(10)-N(2))-methyltransferase n=1 Tax=Teratosphaeria destructans TaxID=418781 RepID=A0A9W7SM73_9PEZI|nr:tRNA (guanine(10)-N2)-methyltransferase [Teratosphaeria destructans]
MDFLIRFVQQHETFRKPETDAIADLLGVELAWLRYTDDSPYAVVRFGNIADPKAAARQLLRRSILGTAIYELWGEGVDYETLHSDTRRRSEHLWNQYRQPSFRFELDSFHGSRNKDEQRNIFESFRYMDFQGPIRMRDPDQQFVVFEESVLNGKLPHRIFCGRLVAESGRKAMNKYNLKKRKYIATTSMDAELSLVTANMAQAAPGTLAYDPFMGTGSFPVACAHFGASVFGSDLDGRSVRGKPGRNVAANFDQYGTSACYLGGFAADITNTPLRNGRILDAIICDPPYGVREGLKVLGSTRVARREVVYLADGTPAHLQPNYVAPKKPYSFLRMMDDILDFAYDRLVDGGRLCMWVPVAGSAEGVEPPDTTTDGQAPSGDSIAPERLYKVAEDDVPRHPGLRLVSHCRQDFNKWSRRLLTYARRKDGEGDSEALLAYKTQRLTLAAEGDAPGSKATADDLNEFRKRYFLGFKGPAASKEGAEMEAEASAKNDG